MRVIKLRIAPKFFEAVISGVKRSEVRYNDRMFQVGDILCLCEVREHDASQFTGRTEWRRITHVLHDFDVHPDICGLKQGYVVLSLSEPVPSQFPVAVAERMERVVA